MSYYSIRGMQVCRETYLKYVEEHDCWGEIVINGKEHDWRWNRHRKVLEAVPELDKEHMFDSECIEPECIKSHVWVGNKKYDIDEWYIEGTEDYPIARANV